MGCFSVIQTRLRIFPFFKRPGFVHRFKRVILVVFQKIEFRMRFGLMKHLNYGISNYKVSTEYTCIRKMQYTCKVNDPIHKRFQQSYISNIDGLWNKWIGQHVSCHFWMCVYLYIQYIYYKYGNIILVHL